jgi:hypothetical protein
MKIAGRDIKVFNLAFCLVGIAILVGVGIYPTHRTIGELDLEIARYEAEIESQKLLFPVFIELLKRSREKSPALLPAPDPKRLPRGDTSQLSESLRQIAGENGITIDSLTPDVESLIDSSGRLKMEAELTGSFHDFRNFLIQIGSVPYLESLEFMRFQASPEKEPLRVTMRFWVLQG